MNRWERRDAIRRSYEQTGKGSYRYTGQWYELERREQRLGRCTAWCVLQIVLTVLLVLGMGVVPAGPMRFARVSGFNYVLLLYGVTLLLGAAAVNYAGRVCFARFRLPMHDSSYAERHGDFTAACAIGALAMAAGQTIYLVRAGQPEDRPWDILLLVLALLLAVLSAAWWHWLRRQTWVTRENTDTPPEG